MDGWDTEKFSCFLTACEELDRTVYEIKNCIRGCYSNCESMEEMKEHCIKLADRILAAAEEIDDLEDNF